MKKCVIITVMMLGNLLLWGCSDESSNSSIDQNTITEVTIGNPTAQEILEIDSKADIFQWDSIIYSTNIEWVNELVLTEGDLVGKIEYNTSNPMDFKDSTANILPIGTEIFKAKERNDVLITKYDDELKYYYQLVEG